MQYKQAKAILIGVAQKARTGSVNVEALRLLSGELPRLGGWPSGSLKNLLWKSASNIQYSPLRRLRLLKQLLGILAAENPPPAKPDKYFSHPLLGPNKKRICLLPHQ